MNSTITQAEALKSQGNLLYQKDRLGAAIDAYTEAITLNPKKAVYFTNRAQCYRKRNNWESVESDCRKAIELDKDSIKAHYMLGLSHLHFNNIKEAVRELEKSLELARCGNCSSDFFDDIWKAISQSKFSEWKQESPSKLKKNNEFRQHLLQLMNEDYEKKKNKILLEKYENIYASNTDQSKSNSTEKSTEKSFVEIFKSYLKPNQSQSQSEQNHPASSPSLSANDADFAKTAADMDADSQSDVKMEDTEEKKIEQNVLVLQFLNERHKEDVKELEKIFDVVNEPYIPSEVPDYLCCPITMDFFRDPVITPYGITYERSALMEHLKRGRRFDPLSGKTLDENSVFPNLAMRECVQSFLKNNGWAFKTGL